MKDDHVAILLEDIDSKIEAVLEAMPSSAEISQRFGALDERLEQIESNVKAIKAAVTDQSAELRDHQHRISDLERAAA